MDADGNPQHAADMRGQINMALDNLEAVLTVAPSDARAGAILGQCRRADFEQLCRRSAFAVTGITRLPPPAALSLIEAAPA